MVAGIEEKDRTMMEVVERMRRETRDIMVNSAIA
jgi:hypothetical protein